MQTRIQILKGQSLALLKKYIEDNCLTIIEGSIAYIDLEQKHYVYKNNDWHVLVNSQGGSASESDPIWIGEKPQYQKKLLDTAIAGATTVEGAIANIDSKITSSQWKRVPFTRTSTDVVFDTPISAEIGKTKTLRITYDVTMGGYSDSNTFDFPISESLPHSPHKFVIRDSGIRLFVDGIGVSNNLTGIKFGAETDDTFYELRDPQDRVYSPDSVIKLEIKEEVIV